jgi:hypothetical protein
LASDKRTYRFSNNRMVRPQDGHRRAEADRRVEPNFSPDLTNQSSGSDSYSQGTKVFDEWKEQSSFSVPHDIEEASSVPGRRCRVARPAGKIQPADRPHPGTNPPAEDPPLVTDLSSALLEQARARILLIFSAAMHASRVPRARSECQTGRTDVGHGMKQFRYCVPIHRGMTNRLGALALVRHCYLQLQLPSRIGGRVVRHQAQTFVI